MSDQEATPAVNLEEQSQEMQLKEKSPQEDAAPSAGDGNGETAALPPPPPKPAAENSKERARGSSRDRKRRSLSRSRDKGEKRRSRSRSTSRDRRRGKDRSRSRDRVKDRSRSRDRRRRSSRERSARSRSRDRMVGLRSRSRDRRRSRSRERSRRNSRSSERGAPANNASTIPGLGGPLPPPPPLPEHLSGGSLPGPPGVPPNIAALQAAQALQAQQQALQVQLQAQQAQQALAAQVQLLTAQANSAAMLGDRRAREIFVGNLNRGLVSAEMLRELFNAVLANMVPDPLVNPPVMTARLDATGKYGFVELRSPELASAATQLHKMELCGKPMTVERAKGFTDSNAHLTTAAQKMQLAQVFAQQLGGGAPGLAVPGFVAGAVPGGAPLAAAIPAPAFPPAASSGPGAATTVVLLENVMNVSSVRNDQERRELQTDVYQEASKFGTLTGITIPVPPPTVADTEPCRVYLKFTSVLDAARCQQTMEGRMFDDNKVHAYYTSETDFFRAQAGEWLPSHVPAFR